EALPKDKLPKSTRQRLQTLKRGHLENIRSISVLIAPLLAWNETSQALISERVPKQQTAMAYISTLFRDWAWGDQELETFVQLLSPLIQMKPEIALFLGAGASGLPAKIHERFQIQKSIAIDINPLLMFAAEKILAGQVVEMVEFPNYPNHLKDVAVFHKLKRHTGALPDFYQILADAQNPPIQSEIADLIVTPWFIDIVPSDFPSLATQINRCLKSGGQWIQIGLLGYERMDPAQRYTHEEIKELTESCGFEVLASESDPVPYLSSPHSPLGRRDRLTLFSATKIRNCPPRPLFQQFPKWVTETNVSIPRSPQVTDFEFKTQVYSYVLNQIDGKKTALDISRDLATTLGVSQKEALASVQNFLIQFFENKIQREF
ncbi:MAG: hypothetical protein K2X47_02545, partial [Bdellovibrionales bacterium]|nr:hypothetical protein [Bdellovibrionales bacterium]